MLRDTGRCRLVGMRRSVMGAGGVCIDRQPTVHDARVQLHRLRQTDDEPDRKHTGQNPKESATTHASNIGAAESKA